ncbi:heavy metal translocating P-type ATPase metal-binding domain-containing protein [Echinicola sp. CAU 1574]|uniref:Heavy metal translocating P-type ATPase metal-binding domain-containing protein n=1 Tax=Echinicola arenosa TaxID=2774144 RepID=A0ABR9AGT3_9BACT|nr:heavy metal translocating P-type ATPase metal-binding domain-containing protein [Echinicola arenosa]MBD8487145.1 heavy metal translocating P-type ATPase metal-binding domain-containing protein [Echinicola arenosa]
MEDIKDEHIVLCFHCGEKCQEDALIFDQREFCCHGCKLVYEVLQENGLSSYYAYGENPGTKAPIGDQATNRFDYLQEPEVIQQLVDFQNDIETHITFSVPAIHCASCIWLLENLHQLNENIVSGRVDFIKKEANIKFHHQQLSLSEVVRLLTKIGYEPAINLSNLEADKSKSSIDKRLVYQLAIAGFCFGNMMFFSLPEYFSEVSLLEENFRGLFNYLNLFLALPVVFYAASDYYRSAWFSLKNGRVNMDVPIVIGIVALFLYSLFEVLFTAGSGYFDSLGGLLFFLLLGKYYQQKTFETLSFDRDYKAYFPLAITRISGQIEEVVSLPKLEVGDTIKVRKGELIPADSLLIDGEAQIDYSFVTGEEIPVPVNRGQVIYAGGRQQSGPILLNVQKSPSQGYLTNLWNHDSFKKKKKYGLGSLADALSGKFTLVVLLTAFGTLAYWSFWDISMAVRAFTSVLIVACPCALALSTPFTLGNTLRVFGRMGFYLKNSRVVEDLAKVDTYVFDKTGTLTDPATAKVSFVGIGLTEELKAAIKGMVQYSIHPLSIRINSWLGQVKPAYVEGLEEYPGRGIEAIYCSGIIRMGSAKWLGLGEVHTADNGNRVYLSVEGEVYGYFHIQSSLRKGVVKVIDDLKSYGSIHLLSGDHDHERSNLVKAMGAEVIMNFNQGPTDKLQYLKKLNDQGKQTLMVGDGLNDAGALQEGLVGVAVSDQVTHFSPASDAIMNASILGDLPNMIGLAKDSKRVIISSFVISFFYNLLGVTLAVQGMISPVVCAIIMPLSSISVVLFTTLAVNYFAMKRGLKKNWTWK